MRSNPMAVAAVLLCGVSPLISQMTASFDVASVKSNKSDDPATSNFPLGPGNAYISNGGHFTAKNFPLVTYIAFAFKVTGDQARSLVMQLPGWVLSERFDITARTDGNPAKDTKDQMRLMMRALLADRFKMAARYETRQVPVFALLPVKSGKMGPRIQSHPGDAPCLAAAPGPAPPPAIAGGYPALCGGFVAMPSGTPGHSREGARNVTMEFIASGLSAMGDLGRPVLDRTALSGTFDFVLEWVPESNAPPVPDAEPRQVPSGPSFMEALKDQLGLKLESQKAPSDYLVIDHIERPSEN